MENFVKFRSKLIHFLFPFVERFFLVVSTVLFLAAWAIPQTYWQIKVVLFGLWLETIEINSAGIMERDCLPIQPGSGSFYHIYRFIDNTAFLLLLLIYLGVLLFREPLWLLNSFLGVLILTSIVRAIGDRKYRPKKPEE